VHFQVHALERFLQVLLMAAGHDDVVGPQTQVVLQPADVLGRHKAGPQQPVSVQGGLPLAVLHVGFAARKVFDVFAIDHDDRGGGARDKWRQENGRARPAFSSTS
jgi:hypothetical protein